MAAMVTCECLDSATASRIDPEVPRCDVVPINDLRVCTDSAHLAASSDIFANRITVRFDDCKGAVDGIEERHSIRKTVAFLFYDALRE